MKVFGDKECAEVSLVEVMGNDWTPATIARTSYRNKKQYTDEENIRLTRYLLKHKHLTPFEFCMLRFYMVLPIFVARQIVRHRTSSINEVSLRYVTSEAEKWYLPSLERMNTQSDNNKQGSSNLLVSNPEVLRKLMNSSMVSSMACYKNLLESGLSREVARMVLPLSTYTEWYWQVNLRNFLHFLELRMDNHAQLETQQYAKIMYTLAKEKFPIIMDIWETNLHENT